MNSALCILHYELCIISHSVFDVLISKNIVSSSEVRSNVDPECSDQIKDNWTSYGQE